MSVTSPILSTLPPPPEPAAGVDDPESPPPQAAARRATAATAASAPVTRMRGRFTLPPEMEWPENGGHPTTTAAPLPGAWPLSPIIYDPGHAGGHVAGPRG